MRNSVFLCSAAACLARRRTSIRSGSLRRRRSSAVSSVGVRASGLILHQVDLASARMQRSHMKMRFSEEIAPVELGGMIHSARVSRGLSQQGLARRTGITRESVARIEAGRLCYPDTLCRLEFALGFARRGERPPWRHHLELWGADAMADPNPGPVARMRRLQLKLPLRSVAAAARVSVATLSRFERRQGESRALSPWSYNKARELVQVVSPALLAALKFDDEEALRRYGAELTMSASDRKFSIASGRRKPLEKG